MLRDGVVVAITNRVDEILFRQARESNFIAAKNRRQSPKKTLYRR